MSTRRERPRLLTLAAVAVAAACALAAVAFGFVQVYKNSFNTRAQYGEINKLSGKDCGRAYRSGLKLMQVRAKEGPANCSYKLPIQGSSSHPDHRFDAVAKLHKETPNSIRDEAYVSISLRVGSGNRYELRIEPRGRNWSLERRPDGAAFPVGGRDGAIKVPGKNNKLRLIAVGDRIRALVNGTELADVVDPNSGPVDGAKVYFGVGQDEQTNKDTYANFDKLRVSVPNP